MPALYDSIGAGYETLRRPDPRIASRLHAALGPARTVLNVGAGTGNYEPAERAVLAVEPAARMIQRRPPGSAPVVQATAAALPFAEGTFDAALAVLTVHHWPDPLAGLREVRRVTRGRIVILTFDPASRPWLTDYLPGLAALDEAQMPPLEVYRTALGTLRVEPLLTPHDCVDGFLHAYWRRPHAYLDPRIRSGSSSFHALKDVDAGLGRLKADLDSGDWQGRYAHLTGLEEYDAGYRLLVAEPSGNPPDH
jgi:SAM-dependent methyltransferase